MEIVILIIIIAVLAFILFIALRKIVEGITEDSKDYYFKKVQDFDAEISKKQEELQNLDTKTIKEEEIVKNNERVEEKTVVDSKLLDVMNATEYEGLNALKIANKVDEIFQVDEEKILADFLTKATVNENYKVYQTLMDRFSPNLIYKLKMLDRASQVTMIKKLLTDAELEVFEAYLNKYKFKLDKFLLDLAMLIENNLPNIEVIVGNKTKNYDYLSPYIKTTYSEDIYKGMIIKYQDRIYDYSINERDV